MPRCRSHGRSRNPLVAIVGLTVLATGGARAAIYQVSNTADNGAGSLRQAIIDANTSPGLDTITFAIPGPGPHTIEPLSALPEITDLVSIDGYTQPGASRGTFAPGGDGALMIELDGSMAGDDAPGLVLMASSSSIEGLAINGFGDSGIRVDFGHVLNVIQGNLVGPDVDGKAVIGNGGQGVELLGNRNTVGGPCAGCGNVIAGNVEDGVFVLDNSIRNVISRNSIFANGPDDPRALGIDLYLPGNRGVNENDDCDEDGGSNFMQNFPVLTGADSDGTETTITGTLESAPSTSFTVELFASGECDRSRFGEGETFLGATGVTTGPGCAGEFSLTLPVAVSDGTVITATATDADGNTSEFSECFEASGPQPHDFAVVRLKAKKRITLSERSPTVVGTLVVGIQNRSPHAETIANPDVLRELVFVSILSLAGGACGEIETELILPPRFPITMPPKGTLKLTYRSTFACANDPLPSSRTEPHDDYRVIASVDHAALDGLADSHLIDDQCPRGPLPGLLDPFPDGSIKDKGCGGEDRSTGQLGADVRIDIVVR
jgi:hypothetical protein